MKARVTSAARRAVRWTLLPAIAMSAMLVSLPAARAWGQQATTAQMDNEINWHAVGRASLSDNARAQAPYQSHQRSARERSGY
jgi:hypothetical protein